MEAGTEGRIQGRGRSGEVRDVILLTGATGFVGAFVLAALCARVERARVTCLVRAASASVARERLETAMRGYGLWSTQVAARVEVVAGDIGHQRLGLSPAGHAALLREVGCVVHCAARVSSALPYAALHESNVLGTVRHSRAHYSSRQCHSAAGHLRSCCTPVALLCYVTGVSQASHTLVAFLGRPVTSRYIPRLVR